MIVPRGIVGVMRAILVMLFPKDRSEETLSPYKFPPPQRPSRRSRWPYAERIGPNSYDEAGIVGLGTTDWRLWLGVGHGLGEPQPELPIRTDVAIDEVFKRFRNIVTIDIAAALDFEGDIS
jgi:hypothetical protein